jgi:hypothetical protein
MTPLSITRSNQSSIPLSKLHAIPLPPILVDINAMVYILLDIRQKKQRILEAMQQPNAEYRDLNTLCIGQYA